MTTSLTTTQEIPSITATEDVPAVLTTTESVADLMAATLTPTLEITVTETATPVPPTPTPARPEVKVYAVQEGDNLFVIAERFGISQDTLVWSNPSLGEHPDLLSIGQQIDIMPVDGVLHKVKKGDTLAAIAKRYSVDVARITEYNGITDPSTIQIDQKLIVPGGVKPPDPKPVAKAAGQSGGEVGIAGASKGRLMIPAGAGGESGAPAQAGRFAWPTRGTISQGYGKYHGAIDIANRRGTPVVAGDAGTVTFAGVSGGLGYAVQVDHGDGFSTTYCHLDSISVQPGQQVAKGEGIGQMGSTGNSTGPHLHFIVLFKGTVINPMQYLP